MIGAAMIDPMIPVLKKMPRILLQGWRLLALPGEIHGLETFRTSSISILASILAGTFQVVHAATRLHKNRINSLSVFYFFATAILIIIQFFLRTGPAGSPQCVDRTAISEIFDADRLAGGRNAHP
jgi:hypothetical protein